MAPAWPWTDGESSLAIARATQSTPLQTLQCSAQYSESSAEAIVEANHSCVHVQLMHAEAVSFKQR